MAKAAANIGSEMINGLIRGYVMRRGMDKDDADRAFQEEQRTNARADRARDDEERTVLRGAAAPVAVQEGAGGALKPDTMDNSDVGQPGEAPVDASAGAYRVLGQNFADKGAADAAATSANAPDAVLKRTAAAYRQIGKPAEALRLETEGITAKNAQFQLEKGQKEWVDKQFDQKLATIQTPDDMAGVLAGSPVAQGRKVTAAASPDGKTFDLVAHNDDGSTVKLNTSPIGVEAGGIKKAIVAFSQGMSPAEKIGALQHFETFDEQRRQFEENKTLEREKMAEQARQFGVNKTLQERQIGISAGHLGVAQQGLALQREKMDADLKNDPLHNLPGAVKLSVKGQDHVIDGIEKAITDAQARNEWDEKSEGAKNLRVRLVKAQEARDALLKPYVGEGGAAPAGGDYMGYRGGNNPSAAAPRPANVAPGATPPPMAARGLPMGAAQAAPAPAAAPAAAPVAAPPAQPAADPLLKALGADGNNSVSRVVAQNAPALRQAADTVRAAQAEVVQAAQSGNQQAVAAAMQKAAAAGQAFDAMVKDYNPAQAKAIKSAVGL